MEGGAGEGVKEVGVLKGLKVEVEGAKYGWEKGVKEGYCSSQAHIGYNVGSTQILYSQLAVRLLPDHVQAGRLLDHKGRPHVLFPLRADGPLVALLALVPFLVVLLLVLQVLRIIPILSKRR